MGAPDCLLCRIASGKVRVDRIVESTRVIGFMNEIEALSRGHAVFFPKRHVPGLHEVEDEALAEMLVLVKRVAVALELPAYNVLVNTGALAGQTVFHAHMHLIPKRTEHEGLRYARAGRRISQAEMARLVREQLETGGEPDHRSSLGPSRPGPSHVALPSGGESTEGKRAKSPRLVAAATRRAEQGGFVLRTELKKRGTGE